MGNVAPKRKISVETMERTMKVSHESNAELSVAKYAKYEGCKRATYRSPKGDVRKENSKQYANAQQRKWTTKVHKTSQCLWN